MPDEKKRNINVKKRRKEVSALRQIQEKRRRGNLRDILIA